MYLFFVLISLLQFPVNCDFLVCYLYFGPINDMGWTYTHNLARAAVDRQLGTRSKYVEGFGFMDDATQRRTLDESIQNGCNVIFTGSGALTLITIEYAKANPQVRFFNLGGVAPPDLANMGGSVIKVHQGCYVNGVIAAMTVGVVHVGYVGSTYMSDSLLCVNAFYLGAHSINKNIKLTLIHTGSWFAPREERIATLRLIDKGAQIINYDSDSTTPVEVAKANGILSFGMKVDATAIFGESNLASQVFVWTSIFADAIEAAMDSHNSSLWWSSRNANKFVGFDEQALSLGSYSVDVNEAQQGAAYNLIKKFSSGDDFVFCREGGFKTFCPSGATKPSMSFGGTPPMFIFPCNQSFSKKSCLSDEDMLATTWLVEGIDDLGLLTVPKSCSPGFYEDPLAAELCIPCPAGSFTTEKDRRACELCLPGSFNKGLQNTKCDPCSAGFFADDDGNANCSTCPLGKFSPRGSGTCMLCKLGFYGSAEGASTCTICAPGRYASTEGSSECSSCSDILMGSTTRLMGADDVTACVCPAGYFNTRDYSSHEAPACEACPEGVSCPGFSVLGDPQETLIPGYYADPLNVLDGVWQCMSEDVCVGQVHAGGEPCAAHRRGLNCGLCTEGYYATGWDGASCEECKGRFVGLPLAFCALLAFAGGLSYTWNRKANRRSIGMARTRSLLLPITMGLILSLVQFLGILGTLSFHWPYEFVSVVGRLGIFLFNLEILAPNCFFPETLLFSYLARIAIPVTTVATFFFWYFFSKLLFGLTHGRFRAFSIYAIFNILGMVVQALYISLVNSTVVVLECYGSPNGKFAVRRYPYVECYTSDHYVAFPFAIIALFFYVIGIYAFLCYLTWIAPHRASNRHFAIATDFIFYKYQYSRWWFGLVLMFRSALLGLVTVVEPTDGHRQFILMLFILIASFAAHVLYYPFIDRYANKLEIAQLCLLIGVLGLGSWFIEDRDFDGVEKQTTRVLTFILCSCVGLSMTIYAVALAFGIYLAWNPSKVIHLSSQEASAVLKKLRPVAALILSLDDIELHSMLFRLTYIDRWYFLEMSNVALLELAGLACQKNRRLSPKMRTVQSDEALWELARSVDTINVKDGVSSGQRLPYDIAFDHDRIRDEISDQQSGDADSLSKENLVWL